MGIWINVSSTNALGEAQVLFARKPMPTAISPNEITAGVAPEEIFSAGDKKIEIKLPSGEIIPVGVLKVIS